VQRLEEWIMRIVTAAIVGGLGDVLTRKSRQNGLVRMTSALMLMLVAAAPLQELDIQAWLTRWEREARVGQRAADEGEAVQAILTREYAAQQLAAYVESCADAVEITCQAQVELDEAMIPVGVHLSFAQRPAQGALEGLRQQLCAQMGLTDSQIEVTGI